MASWGQQPPHQGGYVSDGHVERLRGKNSRLLFFSSAPHLQLVTHKWVTAIPRLLQPMAVRLRSLMYPVAVLLTNSTEERLLAMDTELHSNSITSLQAAVWAQQDMEDNRQCNMGHRQGLILRCGVGFRSGVCRIGSRVWSGMFTCTVLQQTMNNLNVEVLN